MVGVGRVTAPSPGKTTTLRFKSNDATMTQRTYEHSAYWYAYHYGWTYSEAKTYTTSTSTPTVRA